MQILANTSIKQAIKILNKYGSKTIVVIGNNRKLLGTLSDGDIRKSIIKGFFSKIKLTAQGQLVRILALVFLIPLILSCLAL